MKTGRSANGKGHYWTIHPANLEDFSRGDFRRRRAQRRVRRSLGLTVPEEDDEDDDELPLDNTNCLLSPNSLSPSPGGGSSVGAFMSLGKSTTSTMFNPVGAIRNGLNFHVPNNYSQLNVTTKSQAARPFDNHTVTAFKRTTLDADLTDEEWYVFKNKNLFQIQFHIFVINKI